MKNHILIITSSLLLLTITCLQTKKKEPEIKISFRFYHLIENQVAHIDTSLYSIMKVVYTDSLHSDTTYIPREQFVL